MLCTIGARRSGLQQGPDGGKDARFVGKAAQYPSPSEPWDGRFVIQAKHTDLINRKFSESSFSGDAPSSILSNKLPRIKRLSRDGELDYYLMFSNPRLAGVAEEKIRKRIAHETNMPEDAIRLIGEEDLDRYLK